MRLILSLLFLGCLYVRPLLAASSSSEWKNYFFIEAGAYAYNLRQRFSVPPGYDKSVSAIKGFTRLHPGFSLGKGWHFEPSFGTMLFTRDGIDGKSSVFDSHLALQLALPFWGPFRFRIGPGMEWVWLLSKEQDVDLNNGTSVSTFYTPGRSTHVFLFTATAGFTIRLHNRWAIHLDVYVPEIMSKLRREYHASASLGVRL